MSGESGKDIFSRDRAEPFEILSHPSRIGMLQALAESPLGFSELKRALRIESSGPLQFHLEQIAIGISVPISSMTMTGFGLTGHMSTPYGHQFWDPFTEVARAEPYSSARINGTLYFGPLSPEHNGTRRITTLYNYLVEEGINISSTTMRATFSNDVPFVQVDKTLRLSYAEIVLSSNR